MSSIPADLSVPGQAHLKARFARRRKHFLAIAVAALAVMAIALGVTFTADTGTTTVSVTGTSVGSKVTMAGGTLPGGQGWKYGTGTGKATAASPSWSPAVGVPGAVSTAGDLAFVDATGADGSATEIVTVYITNLASLALDYTSFAWPVELYCTTNAGTSWTNVNSSTTYLTNTGGSISWTVTNAASQYCEATMDTGGSYYATATTSADLSPAFYVTVQS